MNWIISDIHGCHHTLLKLLARIEMQDSSPFYVFVGDYFDRGKYAHKVVEHILSLPNYIALRGNHDEVIDFLVNGHSMTPASEWVWGEPTINKIANWWVINGLNDTFDCYDVRAIASQIPYSPTIDYRAKVEELRDNMPESHKSFLYGLKMYWENDTHFACHAYLDPALELPRELRFLSSDFYYSMLWGRFRPDPIGGIDSRIVPKWDKIGVFGHTPVKFYQMVVPIRHHNIRLIDAGVYQNEYLVGYCCERDEFLTVACELCDIEGDCEG